MQIEVFVKTWSMKYQDSEQFSINSDEFAIIFHQVNSDNLIIQSLF